jgi:L-alanine-DL-glutamate epimerase-like enolase superfamily enzyme
VHAKVGSDPVREALSLKAMREALGDKVSLRADANQSYTRKEAIKMCQLSQKRALINRILRYLSQ